MTPENIKLEIQKVLDQVPENVLEDIFAYLQEVKKRTASDFTNSQHLKKILSEDRELLKRLAQ